MQFNRNGIAVFIVDYRAVPVCASTDKAQVAHDCRGPLPKDALVNEAQYI